MKTLINSIVFLSLILVTIISCTEEDKNIEITDSIVNLDTSKYAFYNNVELKDLSFDFNRVVEDALYIIEDQDTLAVFPFNYRVKIDLTDLQFEQFQTSTTDLYTRQVTFNGSIIADDVLFVDDGTHLVPNYMYITQEPATNIINVYSHYVTPSFVYDFYIYNDSTPNDGTLYSYLEQDPLPLPQPRIPAVSFRNVDYPLTSTINYNNVENTFFIDGTILYAGQQASNCTFSENSDTITGDFSGTIKVIYRLHYIDTADYTDPTNSSSKVYSYSRVWDIVKYVDIENGELLMIKEDL